MKKEFFFRDRNAGAKIVTKGLDYYEKQTTQQTVMCCMFGLLFMVLNLYLWLRTILIVIKDPSSDTRAHELNPQSRRLRFYEAEAMVWEGENNM